MKVVAFDKTGTITEGKPTLVEATPFRKGGSDPELAKGKLGDFELQVLSSLEATSTHPIAHAIVQYAENHNIKILPVQDATNHAGKGIS